MATPKNYTLFDAYVNRGKVLKNFNIDQEQYQSIKDPEEKKSFVIEQAKIHFDEQLKTFNEQLKKKKENIEKMKIDAETKNQKTDLYPWMEIKKPHKQYLESRLKNELLQKIQIPQSFQDKAPKLNLKSSLSEVEIKLQKIQQKKDLLSSGAVLQSSISSTFDDFVKSHETKYKDQYETYHSKFCSCLKCEKNKSHPLLFSTKTNLKLSSQLNKMFSLTTTPKIQLKRPQTAVQQQQSPNQQNKKISITENHNTPQKKWTDFDEFFYRSYRSELRERLANEARTGPWEQVMLGFLRNFEKSYQDKKRIKSASPNKFSSSENPEISLINKVNSIPTLNNCLDKDYIQKKLSKLRPEELDIIETDLADKIINEYESEKSQIKNNRHSYLRQKGKSLKEHLKSEDQKKIKDQNLKVMQIEHKTIANRMRIILKGIDKNLIDIKKRPETKFDYLYKNKYPYNNPLGQQVRMKVPQNWDSYKTLMLFDYFNQKPSDQKVPMAKKLKFNKANPMEYFAQKFAGGPLVFAEDEEKRRVSLKLIMNAIKIWKNKKSSMTVEKKLIEKFQKKQHALDILKTETLTQQTQDSENINSFGFSYSDLQKAIFHNDYQTIENNAAIISEEVVNKPNLENNTCFYEAVKFKLHQVVSALMKIPQIDINKRCEGGNTALHIAFANKDIEMIHFLMKYKANPEVINLQKKVPHQMADKQFLLEIGYNPVNNTLK